MTTSPRHAEHVTKAKMLDHVTRSARDLERDDMRGHHDSIHETRFYFVSGKSRRERERERERERKIDRYKRD